MIGQQHTHTQGKLDRDEALGHLNIFPVTDNVADTANLETGRPAMITALQRTNEDNMHVMCYFLNRHCGSPLLIVGRPR